MEDNILIFKDIVFPIIWIVSWILTIYVSFISSWLLNKKKTLLTSEKKYESIKKIGSITLVVALFYYLILFGIFNWQFRWRFFSFLFSIAVVLILDRFLIAYYYDKSFTNLKLCGIKLFWISKTYTVLRGFSIIIFTILNLIGFFKVGPVIIIISSNVVFGIPEMYINYVKSKLYSSKPIVLDPNDPLRNYKMYNNYIENNPDSSKSIVLNPNDPFRNHIFWTDLRSTDQTSPSNEDKNHNFAKTLIFEPKQNSLAIYIKKNIIFKKFLYSVPEYTLDLYYSKSNDTLYLSKASNRIAENFIIKKGNIYIHTITKLKYFIPNLSYAEQEKLTLQNYPEYYETFYKEIK